MIRAVLGGSFDPVHDGHVAMARRVLADGLADRLLILPAGRSPHKDLPEAPAADRLAMVRLAFAGMSGVDVDDRELRRRGLSYTVDTLRELVREHPADAWRLVIGADNLASFATWSRPAEILDLVELVVLARADSPLALPDAVAAGRCVVVADFHAPVSSRDIRAILAEGRLPATGLAPAVAEHIRARGLYGA